MSGQRGLKGQTMRGLEGQTEGPWLCPLGHGEPAGWGYRGRRGFGEREPGGQKRGPWSSVHMRGDEARVGVERGLTWGG